MTLGDLKKQSYALIEELDTTDTSLTADDDLAAKMNFVINQIQNELCRIKKIPKYKEIVVDTSTKDTYELKDIDTDIYQLDIIRGIDCELKADGTIIKCKEDGKMEVEYYVYPTQITDTTLDTTTLNLSTDVLEIMPYGIAADILKSDVSNAYGNVYSQRYNELKQQLDMRYSLPSVEFTGGIEI